MKLLYLFAACLVAAACSMATDESTSGPEMATIPAASFFMGETVDYGYGEIDGPRHEVIIDRPFALSVTEVTVGEFRRFVEDTDHVSDPCCFVSL